MLCRSSRRRHHRLTPVECGLRERSVETAAELRFGEVLVLNGPPQARVETQKDAKGKTREVADEVEMLVVITPEQVDSQKTAIFPKPVSTGYGSYVPAPAATKATHPNPMRTGYVEVPSARGAAKATHPNPVRASFVPAPTAAKASDAKKRK